MNPTVSPTGGAALDPTMHRALWILAAALACLAGCGFHSGNAPSDASPDVNAADTDAPNAGPCVPWNALNVMPCDAAIGAPRDLTLPAGAYVLDTDMGQLSGTLTQPLPGALIAQTAGPMVRVVNLGQLSIASGATLSITGTHPVVFVVHGDATILGTIDVSARVDGIISSSTAGPGGDDASACAGGTGADGLAATGAGGAGGAGGGGFGDNGGDGGDGNGAGKGGHGSHGSATGNAMLVPLRGGCAGGRGGATIALAAGGRTGNGGGALEITALGMIDVSGMLVAAGSGGGTPALGNAGGGAGGSGGAILLDGNTVHVGASGALCANGGGGGEGGQIAGTGDPGANGTCSATLAARGGAMQADGGDGGDGGWLGATKGLNGANGTAGAGGGGAGGSVGRIRVHGRTTRKIENSAIVSPAATQ